MCPKYRFYAKSTRGGFFFLGVHLCRKVESGPTKTGWLVQPVVCLLRPLSVHCTDAPVHTVRPCMDEKGGCYGDN